jgi:hypothetical protein
MLALVIPVAYHYQNIIINVCPSNSAVKYYCIIVNTLQLYILKKINETLRCRIDSFFKNLLDGVSEWVSEWLLLNVKWEMFDYIIARTSYIRWDYNDVCFVLDQHTLVVFFILLAHCKNTTHVEISLHSDTLSWFQANQS